MLKPIIRLIPPMRVIMSIDPRRLVERGRLTSFAPIVFMIVTVLGGMILLSTSRPTQTRDILKRAPLSSQEWILLTYREQNPKEPLTPQTQKFLELSWLTGPNEGDIMFQRALFGIAAWENLPASFQQNMLRDLAGGLTYLPDIPARQLRTFIAEKDPKVREEIKAGLLARNVSAQRLSGAGF
jgi:hypothetical protein